MIASFKDKPTEHLFKDERVKKFVSCERSAMRKLTMLHNASALKDLKSPPGNQLEQLQGKLHPRYSIRINDQWRLVFLWIDNNAHEVEIIDYH